MARRKRKVNVTQAVKDYLAVNPDHKPREIASALSEQGIDVKPTYVSSIKSKITHATEGVEGLPAADAPAPRRRGRPRKQEAAVVASGGVDYKHLLEAKSFVRSMGGIHAARQVLDAYASLQ